MLSRLSISNSVDAIALVECNEIKGNMKTIIKTIFPIIVVAVMLTCCNGPVSTIHHTENSGRRPNEWVGPETPKRKIYAG